MCPTHRSDDLDREPSLQSVVIVGAGHAGVQAADSLRSGGHRGSITILGDESDLPYQRPPLSKEHLAAGHDPTQVLPLRGDKYFADNEIDMRLGIQAITIDRHTRTVGLSDGSALPFDALILATGATNRPLGVPGSDLTGVHMLRSLADARSVQNTLATALSVIVVGGGFIGLEFAAAVRARGLPVTVFESGGRTLERAVSQATSSFVAAAHRDAGIDLRLGETVTEFVERDGRVAAAISSTGKRYDADLVLAGIGVIPRVDLAHRAGLDVEDGVVVDEHLRTSDPTIYAIGDCASHPCTHGGRRLRLESVQNATDQAKHVAAEILGTSAPYDRLPWFWSHQGSVKLQIAGLRQPDDETVVLGDPAVGKFSVCCLRDGRLAAVESINRPADHMAARRLLAAGQPTAPRDLREPDFDLKRFATEATAALGR